MDKAPEPVPADWLTLLEESEADLAAGRIISSDVVMSDLKAGLARLEDKTRSQEPNRGARGRF